MIADINLQNFRSYKNDSFELSGGVNIVVGPNASGKTNLLEALLVLCRGSSYRARDVELVAHNQTVARLDAHADGDERLVYIEKNDSGSTKKFKINGQELSRLNHTKTLPVVLFEPNHLRILSGPPELRREFIDNLLEQTRAGYGSCLRNYRRALAQRNALLKSRPNSIKDRIFAWDVRLSQLGADITAERLTLIKTINKQAQKIYNQLANEKASLRINYISPLGPENYASSLLRKLGESLETDLERGFTSAGPHRENIEFVLNSHPVQVSASRGENRTILLVAKMLEAKILEAERGQKPILLMDDVFSELDGVRRQALTSFLQPYQSFITTTDADVVVQHFTETTNIIPTSTK